MDHLIVVWNIGTDPGVPEDKPLSQNSCVLGTIPGLKKFISMFELMI